MAEVRRLVSQDIDKKSSLENGYVIPNGKILGIDYFFGGHEYSRKEVRIELLLRDGSDTTLAVGYGSSFNLRVKENITGDGTKSIVIKMVNGESGALHMTACWYGDLT